MSGVFPEISQNVRVIRIYTVYHISEINAKAAQSPTFPRGTLEKATDFLVKFGQRVVKALKFLTIQSSVCLRRDLCDIICSLE